MDMTGEYSIPAARQRVWEALNDPEILKQCIPGCEEIEKLSPVEWTAKVTAKVGPVKAKFGGKVTLSDLDPPNGYTITGEGTGGAAGFAKGGAKVKLSDEAAGGTLLSYTVQAQVGGKLAQIGSRLIDGASRKMAHDFFARFAAIVGGEAAKAGAAGEAAAEPAISPAPPAAPAPPPAAAAAPRSEPAAAPAAPAQASARLSPIAWVVALAVIVIVILYLFAH